MVVPRAAALRARGRARPSKMCSKFAPSRSKFARQNMMAALVQVNHAAADKSLGANSSFWPVALPPLQCSSRSSRPPFPHQSNDTTCPVQNLKWTRLQYSTIRLTGCFEAHSTPIRKKKYHKSNRPPPKSAHKERNEPLRLVWDRAHSGNHVSKGPIRVRVRVKVRVRVTLGSIYSGVA
jgi:hypothetical protein